MDTMTRYRIRHLPVVEDGRLIGLVSIGDVVKNRLEEMELETNVLRDVVLAGR
jgi:CBS domain-containing protein